MAKINPDLLKELESKLNVSQRTVYRRIRQRQQELILTPHRAALSLANELGIDISKYSSDDDRAAIREAGAQGVQLPVVVRQPPPKKTTRRKKKVDTSLSEYHNPFLEERDISAASSNAEIYPIIYFFENSVRHVVAIVMERSFGKDWWETTTNKRIKDAVTNRIKDEKNRPWHSKRGVAPIYYTDMDNLATIVRGNFDLFRGYFGLDGLNSFLFWLGEIAKTRNIVAHNNPTSRADQDRLKRYVRDWGKLAVEVHKKTN